MHAISMSVDWVVIQAKHEEVDFSYRKSLKYTIQMFKNIDY